MKERLDVLLVSRGYFDSRERAQAAIMAGMVFVGGQISDKAGTKIPEDAEIYVKEDPCKYVSRGGLKLEKSIKSFGIGLKDCICMDIGASTGGFTDCMLMNGASKVYAVDVGYGQLAWKLRNDPRVVNIEKCNVRYLDPDLIKDTVDFISIDVSFISLKLIFPVAVRHLSENGSIVALVKPQFEAGREQMKNSKGIVRDPAVHEETILKACRSAEENGLSVAGLTFSPVTGTKGNIEYLLYLVRNSVFNEKDLRYNQEGLRRIVEESHRELSRNEQR